MNCSWFPKKGGQKKNLSCQSVWKWWLALLCWRSFYHQGDQRPSSAAAAASNLSKRREKKMTIKSIPPQRCHSKNWGSNHPVDCKAQSHRIVRSLFDNELQSHSIHPLRHRRRHSICYQVGVTACRAVLQWDPPRGVTGLWREGQYSKAAPSPQWPHHSTLHVNTVKSWVSLSLSLSKSKSSASLKSYLQKWLHGQSFESILLAKLAITSLYICRSMSLLNLTASPSFWYLCEGFSLCRGSWLPILSLATLLL